MTSLPTPTANPLVDVNLGELERSLQRPRTLLNALLDLMVTAMTVLALIPLFSVVWMLAVRGGKKLSAAALTQLPPAPLEAGGGFGNALLGTLVIVGLATLGTVPFGILNAVYLAQAKPEDRLATGVRFAAKVLTGFPSILAGVFA